MTNPSPSFILGPFRGSRVLAAWMIGLVPVTTSVFSASKGRLFERVSKNETGHYTCQEYFNENNEIFTPLYVSVLLREFL